MLLMRACFVTQTMTKSNPPLPGSPWADNPAVTPPSPRPEYSTAFFSSHAVRGDQIYENHQTANPQGIGDFGGMRAISLGDGVFVTAQSAGLSIHPIYRSRRYRRCLPRCSQCICILSITYASVGSFCAPKFYLTITKR